MTNAVAHYASQLVRRHATRAKNWWQGLSLPQRIYVIGLVLGILLDVLIVVVLHRTSISETHWELEELHPTLIILVNLVWLIIGYLVRKDWRLAASAFWLCGHLGGHW
jgi:hypothetical protein